jgi:crotonobetainyl-CoA:carnitine CoA-transferase CaiB-like acyl-CoA transferase
MWQSALPARLSRTPIGPIRPAPLQGEHSFEVFRSLLGMSVAEYDALVATEVSGCGPTARRDASPS